MGPPPLARVLTSRSPYRAISAKSRARTARHRSRYGLETARGPPSIARRPSANRRPPAEARALFVVVPGDAAIEAITWGDRQRDRFRAEAGCVDRRRQLERPPRLIGPDRKRLLRLEGVEHRRQVGHVGAGLAIRPGIGDGLECGAADLVSTFPVEAFERPPGVRRALGADDVEAGGRAVRRHRRLATADSTMFERN